MSIDVTSPAFDEGAPIPERYARQGSNVPPPLQWSGVPAGTRELALVVQDPDAPRGPFVHWIVAGLPPTAEGVDGGELPSGAVEGRNDFGEVGYDGPEPLKATHLTATCSPCSPSATTPPSVPVPTTRSFTTPCRAKSWPAATWSAPSVADPSAPPSAPSGHLGASATAGQQASLVSPTRCWGRTHG